MSAGALRDRDRASIRAYLEQHADLLTGRVLDFGSGKQPYRDVVERVGGVYVPFDRTDFPASTAEHDEQIPVGPFDAVICNQVVQYLDNPVRVLADLRRMMTPGAYLLMTGPTNWPIVEREDLWRFTPAGITRMLDGAGWVEIEAEQREVFVAECDARWPIGFQVKARA